MPFPTDITVAVVSHNGLDHDKLPRTLRALREAGCPESVVTLYDVASTDASLDYVAQQHPGIRIVRTMENVGPSPSRNQAISDCTTPYLLLLDSDAQLLPDTVTHLHAAIERDPKIGLAVPVSLYGDRPDTIQYAGMQLHFLAEAIIPWQGRPASERDHNEREIGFAPCVALLLRPDAARRAGLFDVRYFVCKEDGDFTHRVRVAGHRIVEVGAARVVHNCTPRGTNLFRRQLGNGWHLMFKCYQKRTLLLILPMIVLHHLLQGAFMLKKGAVGAWLGAHWDFLQRLPDLPRDRAAVARARAARDVDLLRADPLVVRGDVAGGSAKMAYDALCRAYWNGVRFILSGRKPERATT